jgi:hypothetical protein
MDVRRFGREAGSRRPAVSIVAQDANICSSNILSDQRPIVHRFFVDRWGIQKTGDDAPHPFRCRPRPEIHLRACSLLHPGNIFAVENMVYFLYHTTGQSACAEWGENEKISKETGSFQ